MEYEQIKQLIEDIGNSKLTAIDIEFPDGIKIKMEKKEEPRVIVQKEEVTTQQEPSKIEEKPKKQEIGNIVRSPMVGTFYIKPSPTSKPYVELGSAIKKGNVLCIIEAMKLMNEIESEFDGKIEEIYVKDGETVEYGKPLFRIV